MLTSFINSLEELVHVHQQLLTTAEKKKEILVEGNIQALSLLIKEEMQLIRQLGQVEEERLFQTKQLMESLGYTSTKISLNDVLQSITNAMIREKVQNLAEQLEQTITKIQERNQLNSVLIQDSLDFVNQSIELLADGTSGQVNYTHPQQQGAYQAGRKSFFDTKA